MLPNASHIRFLMRSSSIAALSLLFVFCSVILHIVTQFDGTNPQYPVDCGIVFGAAVGKGSIPSAALERRVKKAADLYNAKYVTTLILSGGKGSEWQESEAAVMRKVAMLNGVDPDDIVLEEESTSTFENLKFSGELVEKLCKGACPAPSYTIESVTEEKYDKEDNEGKRGWVYDCTAIVAISDRYHLARISLLAKKQNWDNLETAPASKMLSPIVEAKSVLREALGIIYYSLNGDSIVDYWEKQKFAF